MWCRSTINPHDNQSDGGINVTTQRRHFKDAAMMDSLNFAVKRDGEYLTHMWRSSIYLLLWLFMDSTTACRAASLRVNTIRVCSVHLKLLCWN